MSNNKQTMKLYTEEQVRHAIKMARSSTNIFNTPFLYDQDEVLDKLTPIELPSDEEIEEEAQKQWGNVHRTGVLGFINCAKWMRDKIGGNK